MACPPQEAARRLKQYGPNQLDEKPRPTFFQLVLDQLRNFVVILLIVAALISAVLGEWVEAGAILAIVVLNAILGVVQESRAEEALAALKKMAAPEAQSVRDGHRVPGAGRPTGARRYRLPGGGQLHPGRRAPDRGGQSADRRGRPHRRIGPGDQNRHRAHGQRRRPGRPQKHRLHGHRGHLRSRARRGGRHRHAHPARPDRQHAPERGEEDTPLQQRLDQLGKTLGWGALAVCGLVFVVGIVAVGDQRRLLRSIMLSSCS